MRRTSQTSLTSVYVTCEVFVLAFERLDDVVGVIKLSALAVDLGLVVSSVTLRHFQLRLEIGHFALPLVQRLVELTLSLVRLRRYRLRLHVCTQTHSPTAFTPVNCIC